MSNVETVKVGGKTIHIKFSDQPQDSIGLQVKSDLPLVIMPTHAIVDIFSISENPNKVYGFKQNAPATVLTPTSEKSYSSTESGCFLGLDVLGMTPQLDLSKPYPEPTELKELMLTAERDWGWEVTPDAFAAVGLYEHELLTLIKNVGKAVAKLPRHLKRPNLF